MSGPYFCRLGLDSFPMLQFVGENLIPDTMTFDVCESYKDDEDVKHLLDDIVASCRMRAA